MKMIDCSEINNFSKVFDIIKNNGEKVMLDDLIVIERGMEATGILHENFLLAVILKEEDSKLIITDKKKKIATYTVSIENDQLNFEAHESRLDTAQDIQERKDNWCKLAASLLEKYD